VNSTAVLSAIVLVTERYDDVEATYYEYKEGLEGTGLSHEIVYVLDGPYREVSKSLRRLRELGEQISVISLAKSFGEATAINVGFEAARGDIIMLLPAFLQVRGDQLPKLVEAMGGSDLVVAQRTGLRNSWINRLQSAMFSKLVCWISGLDLHDAGCKLRLLRRQVLKEVYVYGDLDRFLPIMAYRQGFRVAEVPVARTRQDAGLRIYRPSVYFGRMLDIMTAYFLFKFTKKPLRFFGLLGSGALAIGVLLTAYIIGERLLFGVSLGDRPALFLSGLLIVLGIQVFAIGLVGEIIVFTHGKDVKDYQIDKIVN